MEIRLLAHGSTDYEEMINLRLHVLLNPIGVPASFINKEKEKNDLLIGAYEDTSIIGCCVLTEKNNETVQLRQMAVDQTIQGKGIGRQIVAFAEKIAKERGYSRLMMHARDVVIPFYEKCGYSITGEPFTEVGIPHHIMEKELQ